MKMLKRYKLLVATLMAVSLLYCMVGLMGFSAVRNNFVLYWLTLLDGNLNLIVMVVLWLSLLSLFVLYRRWQLRWYPLLAIVICLIIGTFLLYPERFSYVDDAVLNERKYYLIENIGWDEEWIIYSICECNHFGIVCQCHDFYSYQFPIGGIAFSIVTSGPNSKLVVSGNNQVLYEYGTEEHCYSHPFIGYCLTE